MRAWASGWKSPASWAFRTVQLHAPRRESRTPQKAEEFLAKLDDLGIRITVVFGGFEGESYADIPTVVETVGLVPPATRAARTREMKEIADFARLLGVDAVGLHLGFVPHDAADAAVPRSDRRDAGALRPLRKARPERAFGNRPGTGRRAVEVHRRRRAR